MAPLSVTPAESMSLLPAAKSVAGEIVGAGLDIGKNLLPPREFAQAAIGNIFSFLGTIAPPLLSLALVGMGLKMVVTGQKPKILGG